MRASVAVACGVLGALIASPSARADTERYFVDDGFRPEGVTFGVMTQAGGFVSSSCCDIGGNRGAGGIGLRIGTVAGPRTLWSLQLEGATVPVKDDGRTEFNRHGTLTLGLQHFVRETLWLRGGAGIATYQIEKVEQETLIADLQRTGLAWSSSLGFDFVRFNDVWSFGLSRQDLALSFELHVAGGIYPGGEAEGTTERQKWGAIMQVTTGLGLQWY